MITEVAFISLRFMYSGEFFVVRGVNDIMIISLLSRLFFYFIKYFSNIENIILTANWCYLFL